MCNAIPHLAAGLRGEPFPTPFATPHGVGKSPPLVNFVWGSANLFAGFALAVWRLSTVHSIAGLGLMAAGWLAIGIFAALHFGAVRAKND